jgi:hypothetical protein
MWFSQRTGFLPAISTVLVAGLSLFVCPSSAQEKSVPDVASPPVSASPDSPGKTNTSAAPDKVQKIPVPGPALTPDGKPLYETIHEDWSSLAIGKSELHPETPLSVGPEEHENFTRELIQVKWRPGDPIDLYVIKPKGVAKPPAVLYLYGYQFDTDRFKNDGWCERVTRGGVAAVGFVSALSGQRFHDRPMKQWFVNQLQESLGSTVHDVQFINDYLASRGDIDMNRIAMFGEGSGATVAILAAASDRRIKAIDLVDPWGDWPDWLAKSAIVEVDPEHAAFTKPQFLRTVSPLDPVKWLPQLKSQAIRLSQTNDDSETPKPSRQRIKAALPRQAKLVEFDNTMDFVATASGGRMFDWIKEQVSALPPSPPASNGKNSSLVTQDLPQKSDASEASISPR